MGWRVSAAARAVSRKCASRELRERSEKREESENGGRGGRRDREKRDSELFHSIAGNSKKNLPFAFVRSRLSLPPTALGSSAKMIASTCSSRPTALLGSSRFRTTSRTVPCHPSFGGKTKPSTSSTPTSSSVVRSPSSTRVVAAPPRALSRPLDPPSAPVTADSDPELLEVLEMCDDAELENVWGLLTGKSD